MQKKMQNWYKKGVKGMGYANIISYLRKYTYYNILNTLIQNLIFIQFLKIIYKFEAV